MSSYLNFYLVPKKKEGQSEESEPIHLMSYSRNSDVYQNYYDYLNPAYYSGADDKVNYTELTPHDAQYVVDKAREDLLKSEKSFDDMVTAYKSLDNLPKDTLEDYILDYTSRKQYIDELKDGIRELEFIAGLVKDLEFSGFEKVLINID